MRTVVIAGLLLAAAPPTMAATTFDSGALGEAKCANANFVCATDTRDSYLNFAAVLNFSANVTVAQIGVYAEIGDPQTIKFLIFDSKYDNGSGTVGSGDVLFSQTRQVRATTSLGYVYSDPLSFTFLAGHTYDVGILGDGHSLTGRYVYSVNPPNGSFDLTTGPVTEYAANANIGYYAYDPAAPTTTGFDHPFTGGYTYSAGFIQLNGTAVPVPGVPEPATWALMIAGFGLVGGALRRRTVVLA